MDIRMKRTIARISTYLLLIVNMVVLAYETAGSYESGSVAMPGSWLGILLLGFVVLVSILIIKRNKAAFNILLLVSIIFWINFFVYVLPVHISDANIDPGYSVFDYYSLGALILQGLCFIILIFLVKGTFEKDLIR